jgi:hypothetical protein
LSGGETLVYATVGGVIPEVVFFYNLRQQSPQLWPTWLRTFSYWAITLVMIGVGTGLAKVYLDSGVKFSPLLAIQVGATAPVALRKLIGSAPEVEPGSYN